MTEVKRSSSFTTRPRVAHITNHGYAGVDVPYGGAPDTGGQNVYVNFVVQAMVELGYHVTVFTRGGFPFFESERIRSGVEPFGDHARYVYVPGGGGEFIRKEDIAPALDEEIDWIEQFIASESEDLGCAPWEVYQIIDTHYWDAGVLGMELGQRWKARAGLGVVEEILAAVDLGDALETELALGSHSTAGSALEQVIGRLLLKTTDTLSPMTSRIEIAINDWASKTQREDGPAIAQEASELATMAFESLHPSLLPVAAAEIVGSTIVEAHDPGLRRIDALFEQTDRHVFTPHSLGVLKEENYRQHPLDVRRALKFCERRNHESAVCASTRAFAATSTEIADRLCTHYGVPARKQFYFPAGIDRSLFRRYDRSELQATYEYLAQKTGKSIEVLEKATIVFETSRMDRTKRKDLLLDAFAKVADRFPDAICLIGGGPENAIFDECQELLAARESLRDRAFLLGFVPDELMYPLFGRADIFVTASEMEGFGLSAAQAAAVGSALVSSDLVPFTLQYVPDDALIVQAGDVDGFADAIERLLADPEDRRARGKRLAERTLMLDWIEQTRAFFDHLRARGFEIQQP